MKKIMVFCLAVFQSAICYAAESIEGFSSIPFGASLMTVEKQVKSLGLSDISTDSDGGFSVVQAKAESSMKNVGEATLWGNSSLTFVVNQSSDRLGLIIQHYPELLTDRLVIKDFTQRFGLPMDDTATKLIYDQIKKDLPEGLQRITVWADHKVENVGAVSRFIRVLYFGNYVSIEYLDTGVL